MALFVEPYLEAIGAIGAENAISFKALAKGLQTNTRGLYNMIETERNLGRPICVATGGGFFLPDESGARHDVSDTADRLRRKARTMLKTADAMEGHLGDTFPFRCNLGDKRQCPETPANTEDFRDLGDLGDLGEGVKNGE